MCERMTNPESQNPGLAIGCLSLAAGLLLAGCGKPSSPADFLPGVEGSPDWVPSGEAVEGERNVSEAHDDYYISRKAELFEDFDEEARQWLPILVRRYDGGFAAAVLEEARERLEALIPEIPYIGGDENQLPGSLLGSVGCLVLYQAMKGRGKTAAEAGKLLYDAVKARAGEPAAPVPPSRQASREELMKRRRERAERSQKRQYPWDWVYEFVEGDGETFDYGYNFFECATHKLYRAQGAEEFLPFYCFLDFPKCELGGLGLTRTMTLSEGHQRCDFRFNEGGKAALEWPPPFVKD